MAPISHITFIVHDLEKSSQFFQLIFDAKEIYNSEEKLFSLSKEKFLLIDDLWIALMEGESLPTQTYNHVAFKIDASELEGYKERIEKAGGTFRESRTRVAGEGESIYFYDFDNHLFELHTGTLADRLRKYKEKNKKSGIVDSAFF